MAAEYDRETGVEPAARSPRSQKQRQKPIAETDGEPVQSSSPAIERRNLSKSDQKIRDLISLYWEEVAAEQSIKRAERGSVTIQVGYNIYKGHIIVKVVECSNLPSLDVTGSSDPYVALQAFPFDVFEDAAAEVQKTSVKKRDLRPTFMENFRIRCRPSALTDAKGGAILFTCYDWDALSGDDMIGEAIYLLPGTENVHAESEVASLDKVTLPLSLPSVPKNQHSAYFELEKRSSDDHAAQFIQSRKKAFKMADSERE